MPYNSSDNKDQLRSLKSAVQSRLSSTFKTRRNTLSALDVISPSPTDSECSTLIDFSTDDIEKTRYENNVETHGAVMLEEENTAWMIERRCNASLRTSQHRPKTSDARHTYANASEMIDEVDRAWCMPSKRTKPKSSTLFSLSPRRQKATPRVGLEPEMLDPEDRAWM